MARARRPQRATSAAAGQPLVAAGEHGIVDGSVAGDNPSENREDRADDGNGRRADSDETSLPAEPAAPAPAATAGGGVRTAFWLGARPRLADVVDLIRGDIDGYRLTRYLLALLLLDWKPKADAVLTAHGRAGGDRASVRAGLLLTPAAALVLPLLSCRTLSWKPEPESAARPVRLLPQPSWPRRLAADQLTGLLPEAALRLRMERIPVTGFDTDWACVTEPGLGPRLAAAGLLRYDKADVRRMLARVAAVSRRFPSNADGAGTETSDTPVEESS